jgi:hypothetical protein
MHSSNILLLSLAALCHGAAIQNERALDLGGQLAEREIPTLGLPTRIPTVTLPTPSGKPKPTEKESKSRHL